MRINANGVDIEVEDSATTQPGADSAAARPAVLLIMGLGMQLIAWPAQLVQALVQAGYRVLRCDNRDAGLSQRFDGLGNPNLWWQGLRYRLGLAPWAPYSLSDMAADALGVLDAVGIARAHVVGASMGGMIAQRMALAAPQRVTSLTSIMSSSGARGLPRPQPQVLRALLTSPRDSSVQAIEDHYVKLFGVIGSPAFATPQAQLRAQVRQGVERGYYRVGTLRQMLAIMADVGRAAQLAQIALPTLVLHGRADPLVPYAHGVDTARRIPGAQLLGIEGMGHDLAPGVVERLLPPLLSHLQAAEARLSTAVTTV